MQKEIGAIADKLRGKFGAKKIILFYNIVLEGRNAKSFEHTLTVCYMDSLGELCYNLLTKDDIATYLDGKFNIFSNYPNSYIVTDIKEQFTKQKNAEPTSEITSFLIDGIEQGIVKPIYTYFATKQFSKDNSPLRPITYHSYKHIYPYYNNRNMDDGLDRNNHDELCWYFNENKNKSGSYSFKNGKTYFMSVKENDYEIIDSLLCRNKSDIGDIIHSMSNIQHTGEYERMYNMRMYPLEDIPNVYDEYGCKFYTLPLFSFGFIG